jgi:hypothetical protein
MNTSNQSETELIEHAIRCGLSPQAAREWAQRQLRPPAPKKGAAETRTPSLFAAIGGAR